MKSRFITQKISISRRGFLRSAGVALALPWLDAMRPAFAADPAPVRRFIGVLNIFGFHAPYFFPESGGADYKPSRFLSRIQEHRDQFTVISGLQHPDVMGGHNCDVSFFTGAAFPGATQFKNTVSVDQCIGEIAPPDVRYPCLSLSTTREGCSYTRAGVQVPPVSSPKALFAKLFLNGTPEEVQMEVERVEAGRSILDRLTQRARRFQAELPQADREKLDQYFTSVRELELQMARTKREARSPKPNPGVAPIQDPGPGEQTRRLGLLLEVARLAMQADLTRAVVVHFGGTTHTPSDPATSYAHHDLTHHGQSPEKLERLARLEEDLIVEWGQFLTRLRNTVDGAGSQLGSTIAVLGSALGNANTHSNVNLPILIAGGRFKHGRHLTFDPRSSTPLCDLYLQILQETGVEIGKFGSSRSTGLSGLAI
ncbi:MAG: hypothetical protein RLZZ253_1126 [Verrucomicrobiota bacterium]